MIDFYISYISSHPFQRFFFAVSLVISEILFMMPYLFRSPKRVRIPLAVALYIVTAFFFPECIFGDFASYVTILIFIVSVACFYICFRYSVRKLFFNCIGAYAAQNIGANCGQILQILCKIPEGWLSFLCNLGVTAVLYVPIFLYVRKKNGKSEDIGINRMRLLGVSLLVLVIANLLMSGFRLEGLSENLLCRITLTLCCVTAFLLQYSVNENETLLSEKELMARLLKTEQEQYKISRETIEMVNIKCHDMKHTLEGLRSASVDPRAMEEVKDAIRLYDGIARTGNSSLDSVLTSKNMYCEKYKIRFTYMADGKLLSFLSPPDIYSLFGNILDNAIESELKEKEEDRYINIVASKHGNLVNIYEENYISDLPTFEDGVPVTDKADKAYHGFGTKSIIYVCEKYNGHVRFSAANHVFSVNILLPLP